MLYKSTNWYQSLICLRLNHLEGNPKAMMGDMSYFEMVRVLEATKEELETLRVKFKASQVKRRELTKQLL